MNTAETADQTTAAESANTSDFGLQELLDQQNRDPLTLQSSPGQSQRSDQLVFKTVRYGLTINTGNFSSVRLDAEVAVPTGSTAESTLEALGEWVRSQSPYSSDERHGMFGERALLHQQINDLERDKVKAEYTYNRVRDALIRLGLTPNLPAVEDLPF